MGQNSNGSNGSLHGDGRIIRDALGNKQDGAATLQAHGASQATEDMQTEQTRTIPITPIQCRVYLDMVALIEKDLPNVSLIRREKALGIIGRHSAGRRDQQCRLLRRMCEDGALSAMDDAGETFYPCMRGVRFINSVSREQVWPRAPAPESKGEKDNGTPQTNEASAADTAQPEAAATMEPGTVKILPPDTRCVVLSPSQAEAYRAILEHSRRHGFAWRTTIELNPVIRPHVQVQQISSLIFHLKERQMLEVRGNFPNREYRPVLRPYSATVNGETVVPIECADSLLDQSDSAGNRSDEGKSPAETPDAPPFANAEPEDGNFDADTPKDELSGSPAPESDGPDNGNPEQEPPGAPAAKAKDMNNDAKLPAEGVAGLSLSELKSKLARKKALQEELAGQKTARTASIREAEQSAAELERQIAEASAELTKIMSRLEQLQDMARLNEEIVSVREEIADLETVIINFDALSRVLAAKR